MAEEKHELNDQELKQAAGGNHIRKVGKKESFFNSKNQEVGHRDFPSGPIYYVPCDKCGKPMHMGWFGWYCDPCNRHLFSISFYMWQGSADSLMDASI